MSSKTGGRVQSQSTGGEAQEAQEAGGEADEAQGAVCTWVRFVLVLPGAETLREMNS